MIALRFLLMFITFISFGCDPSLSWHSVKEMVRRDFPNVNQMSVNELKHSIDTVEASKLLILDVRAKQEFLVSHIKGAVHIDPDTDVSSLQKFLAQLDRKTSIVAYCSVGYRSSAFLSKLESHGFTDLRNLEGSIFEWANTGFPVERNGLEVSEVHPFDARWGVLLHEDLHSYKSGLE